VAADGALSGALAALWLGALWFAAPLLGCRAGDPVGRLRDAVILGVAIPFVLGFLHLLYGPVCLTAAAGLCLARLRRPAPDGRPDGPPRFPNVWLALPVLAAALAAAPALFQPPLEGDTLIYHLPNAAAWVHAGSVWATNTRYWWYPGGSELFASGLLAIGAWWSVGSAGFAAAALAGARIAAWGAELGAPRWVAGSIGAAFVAAPVAAAQAGDLQNDLWLTAFFLETLWQLRDREPAPWSLGTLAIVKPTGMLFAAIAAFAGRARARDLFWLAPLVMWIARDAILWRTADIPPASTAYPLWQTTIAAHGAGGFATLGAALLYAGIPTLWFAALPLFGSAFRAVRAQAAAGVAASLAFVVAPFGFAGSVPQLSSGASLRFDLPAMAVGALVTCAIAARAPLVVGGLAAIAALWGESVWLARYAADVATRLAVPVVAALVALGFAFRERAGRMRVALSIACCAALMIFGACAATRAVGFYDAALAGPDRPTRLYDWLQSERPAAIVAQDIHPGAVSVLSHGTSVSDVIESDPCAQAKSARALLVVGDDPAVPAATRARRFAAARRCGRTLFADRGAIVVAPSLATRP